MSEQEHTRKLSGSASWLAILGAAFFWVWLDRGMFDNALLFSAQQSVVEFATVALMIASVLSFVAVYAVVARKGRWVAWPLKLMVVAACGGALGGLLCLAFRDATGAVFFCLGGVLLGFPWDVKMSFGVLSRFLRGWRKLYCIYPAPGDLTYF